MTNLLQGGLGILEAGTTPTIPPLVIDADLFAPVVAAPRMQHARHVGTRLSAIAGHFGSAV